MEKGETAVTARPQAQYVWRFAGAEFDESRWELRVGGQLVDLEPRPLEVLLHLLRYAGEVVSKEELLEAVYGHTHIGDGALTNAIGKLRRSLRDDEQQLIVTVHRVGYKLVATVQRVEIAGQSAAPLLLKVGDEIPKRPHWKLLSPLGGGNDVEVWLAEHAKTHERRVFKFSPDGLRLSALKREVTLFRILRESLGDRPDLIRVIDWNFEQAPFFIECEYGGLNLQQWAEAQGGLTNVTLATRLEMAASMADSVAAAHSAGVLHKDLKPANVLVHEKPDGYRQVIVTDFGAGQLLLPGRLAELGITKLGFTQTVAVTEDSGTGTPLYLAPEVLSGHVPTVQADLYSLGVIIYQLAVGDLRAPLGPGWERQVKDELLREDIAAAAEVDPLQRLRDAGELAQRLRTLETRRVQRIKERAEHAQAEQTRQALEKMRARRAGMLVALAVLIVGLAASTFLYIEARRARAEAESEAARAKAVSDFLSKDVFAAINSGDKPVKDLTVKTLLDAAAVQVDKRFAVQPESAAEVHAALGNSYDALGAMGDAEQQLTLALDEYEKLNGPGSEDAVKAASPLILDNFVSRTLRQKLPRYEKIALQARGQLGSVDNYV